MEARFGGEETNLKAASAAWVGGTRLVVRALGRGTGGCLGQSGKWDDPHNGAHPPFGAQG